MQAAGSPDTYEIYTSTWRHISEESISHSMRNVHLYGNYKYLDFVV